MLADLTFDLNCSLKWKPHTLFRENVPLSRRKKHSTTVLLNVADRDPVESELFRRDQTSGTISRSESGSI
jgi:hypothetical protein